MHKFINVSALGIGKCNPDLFPTGYGEGWNNLVTLIENAPAAPVVSIDDHERMKREMYAKVKAFEAAAEANRILYEQALKDIKFLLEFIEKKRQEVLVVNKKTDGEMADVCEKFCKNAGRLCFKEGDEPFSCEKFSYNGENRVYENMLCRTGSDMQDKDFSEGLNVTNKTEGPATADTFSYTHDIAHCYKCGTKLEIKYVETGIPFTLFKCPACDFSHKFMGGIQNSIEEYNEAIANEGKDNPGAC